MSTTQKPSPTPGEHSRPRSSSVSSTHSHASDASRLSHPDGESTLSDLEISPTVSFSIIAFSSLITNVYLVAWAVSRLGQQDANRPVAILVAIVGCVGMLLSPVAGHYLNDALWDIARGRPRTALAALVAALAVAVWAILSRLR